MKLFAFFILFFTIINTSNAQALWVGSAGGGDNRSWDDPLNWDSGNVPLDGEDIIIDNGRLNQSDYQHTFGSLQLLNGSNIFLYTDLVLTGDLTIDPTSTVSIDLESLSRYPKVVVAGNYYFNGDIDLIFDNYVPQIGNSYQIIQGNFGSCGASTSDFVDDTQARGFEVTLAVQCQANGVLLTINDLAYTTATYWTGNGADNYWHTAANWHNNQIPDANSKVIINLPEGAFVKTDGAGLTSVYSISVGDNNTLEINGNLETSALIDNTDSATIIWNAGKLQKSSNATLFDVIYNFGTVTLDSPGLKEIENGYQIWNVNTINLNQGNLNINNGKITSFDENAVFNINGDNITIGYNGGTEHSLRFSGNSILKKTTGSGTSFINLSGFKVFGGSKIIVESGTLAIGENIINNGSFAGNGSLQLPSGYVLSGTIAPGASPGTLTFIGNLTTNASTYFNIEINGTMPGTQYDQILVTNEATLDGIINVSLGYAPANNASFEILRATTLNSCNFPAQVTANFNGSTYTFDVVCNNTSLFLNGPNVVSTSNQELQKFTIYPNPTNDYIFINFKTKFDGTWKIFNQLGQIIKQGNIKETQKKIALDKFHSGIYFIKIENNLSNKTSVQSIVLKD